MLLNQERDVNRASLPLPTDKQGRVWCRVQQNLREFGTRHPDRTLRTSGRTKVITNTSTLPHQQMAELTSLGLQTQVHALTLKLA